MEYVDRREDPLIQVVRTHQHNTDSAVLQTASCLKAEVQGETKIKDSIAEKTKERWHVKRMHGQLSRNLDEKLVWSLKCMIIPVIIGATGIVTRSLRKNLEAVPGKHPIDSLQKTAILGTSHIIRKVLQCEA